MSDVPRYSIEVNDESVEITGTLTIREAFDFLSFFEKEGFTTLEDWGDRTTLYLRKRDIEKELTDRINGETLVNLNSIKIINENLTDQNKKNQQRIKDLENLIQKIASDGHNVAEKLKAANENIQRFKSLQKLKDCPEAAKICAMEGPGQEMQDLTGFSQGTVE